MPAAAGDSGGFISSLTREVKAPVLSVLSKHCCARAGVPPGPSMSKMKPVNPQLAPVETVAVTSGKIAVLGGAVIVAASFVSAPEVRLKSTALTTMLITVTVFVHVLLALLTSMTTSPVSTLQTPAARGLSRLPALPPAVTGMVTVIWLPPTGIVTAPPEAVQVRSLLTIEQDTVPVTPPAWTTPTDP